MFVVTLQRSARRLPIVLCLLAFAWLLVVTVGLLPGGEIEPAADAPQPHSPAESQAMFHVEPGFHVELVAAEPHLADPVAICFAADNTIYACEIHGYNIDGHFDVEELNKSGQLDTTVRRIQAPDWAQKKAEAYTYGTVRRLVDDDGDGRVDRATDFADRLPACYGVVPSGDGVVVLCAPHILFLADRDGDGVAEIQEQLFTGLNEGELWSRSNNLRWGIDNWIYASGGRGDATTITGPRLAEAVGMGTNCYRFRADGSAFEPASGMAGGFGLGISDFDDRMLIGNSTSGLQVVPIPYRYQTRNSYVASPATYHSAATFLDVYPVSEPHPWRRKRGSQEAWQKFYGAREATPNGSFTAACSPTFYRGDTFPVEYHGNVFTCESQQNLVCRSLADRQGSKIFLRRPAGFQQREFLASSEGWFRPVNLSTGPDGALYVVDMYREIIEDYSAIPRYLQQQYGLDKGGDRGRIWRVVYDSAPAQEPMKLAGASGEQLVAALRDGSATRRQTAQRLLVEHDATDMTDALTALARDAAATPQARLHALYTLDGLGTLAPDALTVALDDPHFGVRLHALRLSEQHLDGNATLLSKTLDMTDDASAPVRLQLALTLGETADRRAIDALAELALRHADDDWLDDAVLSSVSETGGPLLAEVVLGASDEPARQFARRVAEMLGRRRVDDELAAALKTSSGSTGAVALDMRVACLEGLLDGLRGSGEPGKSSAVREQLGRLLGDEAVGVNLLAYRIAGALGVDDLPEMPKMLVAMRDRVLDDAGGVDERRAALNVLADVSAAQVEEIAGQLLDARQPNEIQLATIDALARSADASAAAAVLGGWSSYSPQVRDRALEVLLTRGSHAMALLDAIEAGTITGESITAQSITSLQRIRLLEFPDADVRRRADALLRRTRVAADEAEERQAAYLAAVAAVPHADAGNASAGREVFIAHCANCHRAGEGDDAFGHDVGPTLSSTINRSDEAIITDILQPSARITAGYRSYTVVTSDGIVIPGVLTSESANSITLRREKGVEDVILRRNIEQMAANETSLMPEGVAEQIKPAAMAHLVAFLRAEFGPQQPGAIKLFDDDAQMIAALPHGSGDVGLETDDVYAGQHALRITALQRYANHIEGWAYPIAETPAAGEYRYLRLAWKSADGDGVGIELADNGDWGPAESQNRRYFSGTNRAPWHARQISAEVPSEWTVVTIDLWRDNGAFVLTGMAPTAMSGTALLDRIELLRSLDDVAP